MTPTIGGLRRRGPLSPTNIMQSLGLQDMWNDGEFNDWQKLAKIGNDLFSRWRSDGVSSDLFASYLLAYKATKIIQSKDHWRSEDPWSLEILDLNFQLVDRLNCLYELTKAQKWLINALVCGASVVSQTPDSDPGFKATAIDLVAQAFELKYQDQHLQGDLEEAIRLSEDAYAMIPRNHRLWGMVASNLANKLESRFAHFTSQADGREDDITRAVELSKEVYENELKYFRGLGRATAAINYSAKFLVRYRAYKDSLEIEKQRTAREDLSKAITLMNEAIDATPNGHVTMWSRHFNLSRALWERADHEPWAAGGQLDLNNALDHSRHALANLPPTSISRSPVMDEIVEIYQRILDKAPDRDTQLVALDGALHWAEQVIVSTKDVDLGDPYQHELRRNRFIRVFNLWKKRYGMTNSEEDSARSSVAMLEIEKLRSSSSTETNPMPDSPSQSEAEPETGVSSNAAPEGIPIEIGEPGQQYRRTVFIRQPISLGTGTTQEDDDGTVPPDSVIAERMKVARIKLFSSPEYHNFQEIMKAVQSSYSVSKLYEAMDLALKGYFEKYQTEAEETGLWWERFEEALYYMADHSETSADFERLGKWAQAIPIKGTAIKSILGTTADGLNRAYERRNDPQLLCLCILVIQKELDFPKIQPIERFELLLKVATQYVSLYDRLGKIEYLPKGIKYAEEAVSLSLTIPDSGSSQSIAVCVLSILLRYRFTRLGTYKDLENGIRWLGDALIRVDDNFAKRVTLLSHLSQLLQTSGVHRKSSLDIRAAITFSQAALESPQGLDREAQLQVLNGLAVQFSKLYGLTQSTAHLDKALLLQEKLVEITTEKHARWPLFAHDLAIVLQKRYALNPGLHQQDLLRARKLSEAAVSLTPENHPNRSKMLLILFRTMASQRDNTPTSVSQSEMLDVIKDTFKCSESATPLDRISAAHAIMVELCNPGNSTQSLEDAYSYGKEAVELLETFSPRWLSNQDRQNLLSNLSGLQSDVACLGIKLGKSVAEVVGLLEQSRNLILGLELDFRQDVSQLKSLNPKLFGEFEDIQAFLSQPEVKEPNLFTMQENSKKNGSVQREEKINEMDHLLGEIRKLPGMEYFQSSPPAGALQNLAKPGPIVLAMSSSALKQSYAIVVKEDGVSIIHLTKMTVEEIGTNITRLRSLLRGPFRTFAERGEQMSEILDWLWKVAVSPILNEIFQTHSSDSDLLPHVCWIQVGFLSQLPFHAARANPYTLGASTMDRVISSYAPSIKALMHAREAPLNFTDIKSVKLLAITTQINIENYKELGELNEEAQEIRAMFPFPDQTTILESPSAAKALKFLKGDSNIVHFACHGESISSNPSKSHLILVKVDTSGIEQIDRLSVEQITETRAGKGGLAFLRACHTADNPSPQLADEVIHLATAFQLAGFNHVLGTLWNTRNRACLGITKLFYRKLFTGLEKSMENQSRVVAVAFHDAVMEWRDGDRDNGNPLLWAPFVHYGA